MNKCDPRLCLYLVGVIDHSTPTTIWFSTREYMWDKLRILYVSYHNRVTPHKLAATVATRAQPAQCGHRVPFMRTACCTMRAQPARRVLRVRSRSSAYTLPPLIRAVCIVPSKWLCPGMRVYSQAERASLSYPFFCCCGTKSSYCGICHRQGRSCRARRFPLSWRKKWQSMCRWVFLPNWRDN